MYRVIHPFTDLKDNNHAYGVGDTFPRAGVSISEERARELSGGANRLGMPLIAAEEKPEAEKRQRRGRKPKEG